MGYGKINALEIELLLECLDKDQDGQINIKDLKQSLEDYDEIY